MIRYTNHYLQKLESILTESLYEVRYEKGNFKSGYCILEDKKIIVLNKFYSLDGKINCLIEIIRQITIEQNLLKEKTQQFYCELQTINT